MLSRWRWIYAGLAALLCAAVLWASISLALMPVESRPTPWQALATGDPDGESAPVTAPTAASEAGDAAASAGGAPESPAPRPVSSPTPTGSSSEDRDETSDTSAVPRESGRPVPVRSGASDSLAVAETSGGTARIRLEDDSAVLESHTAAAGHEARVRRHTEHTPEGGTRGWIRVEFSGETGTSTVLVQWNDGPPTVRTIEAPGSSR